MATQTLGRFGSIQAPPIVAVPVRRSAPKAASPRIVPPPLPSVKAKPNIWLVISVLAIVAVVLNIFIAGYMFASYRNAANAANNVAVSKTESVFPKPETKNGPANAEDQSINMILKGLEDGPKTSAAERLGTHR